MNYRKWLIEDLQTLERYRSSIAQMTSEIETLRAEFTAIKATNYDKMPKASGDNIQEEKLLTNIAKRDELEANLKATVLHVEDMDRLLSMLSNDERRIVQRMFVKREKYAADNLANELGYETAHIYRLKNQALTHLAQLRHGKGYQT